MKEGYEDAKAENSGSASGGPPIAVALPASAGSGQAASSSCGPAPIAEAVAVKTWAAKYPIKHVVAEAKDIDIDALRLRMPNHHF